MIFLIRPRLLREKFNGMSLWPFVIVRHASLLKDKVFLNHEKIHLKQQIELLIVFFYLWYGIEFLVRWIKIGDRYLAYRNISFEREAYNHEVDFSYLKQRKIWSFLNYLKSNSKGK